MKTMCLILAVALVASWAFFGLAYYRKVGRYDVVIEANANTLCQEIKQYCGER